MQTLGFLAVAVRAQGPASPPAAPLPGAAAAAENATLRPVFVKGDTFAYRISVQASERRGSAGETAGFEYRMRQVGTLRLNVLDIDEEGIASMSAVIASMDLRVEAGRPGEDPDVRQIAFVHQAEAAAPEQPAQEAAAAAQADVVSAVADKLARAVIRFDVLPSGRVRRVSGLDGLEEAAGDLDIGEMAMGVFSPNSVVRMLERFWRVDEPRAGDEPGAEPQWLVRAAGAQWSMADERQLGYDHVAMIERTFTVKGPEAAGQSIEFKGKGKLPAKRSDPDPTVPSIALQEWTEEGSVVWDVARSRITQRREKVITDVTATLGPRSRRSRFEFDTEIDAAPAPAPAAAVPAPPAP